MTRKAYRFLVGAVVLIAVFSAISIFQAKAVVPTGQKGNSDQDGSKKEDVQDKQDKKTDKLCDRFGVLSGKMFDKMEERMRNIKDRQQKRIQLFEQKETELRTRLEARRGEIDQNFADHIAKMLSMAKTDSQKAAVAKFQEAVKAAMAERRPAVDAARTAFRAEIGKRIQERNSNVVTAMADFESAVKAAFEKASSDCANGTDAGTLKNTLKESLRAARNSFQNAEKNREQVKTQFQAAIQTRNAAIQKANDTFKEALEAAKAEFQKATGNSGTDTDPEEATDTKSQSKD